MKIFCLRNIPFFAFILPVILLATGCSKTNSSTVVANIPLVTTTGVAINVTGTTAQSGGILDNEENGTITASGVCYSSTNTTPTTTDSKTTDTLYSTGSALRSFTSHLTGLTPNTTYYLRAYCTNVAGVGYGGVLKFTTTANTSVTSTVSTYAGTGTSGYLDGPLTSAMFNNPQGLTFDATGNLYVADAFNDLIRELSTTGSVSTIAGNQNIGVLNGTALSAEFYAPNGEAFDAQGNLYIADFGNNVIRKISTAGVVSTYAGTGIAGYRNGAKDTANWKGTTDSLATFNNPEGVAVDASGNVYVADRGNNVIREILTNGRTKTVAGNRVKGFIDATDAAAFFDNPTGLVLDSKGNLYVTDQGNSALRKITSAGVVTTLAGNPLQPGILNYPSSITIDASGNLFMSDEGGRIMEYNSNGVLYYLAGALNTSGYVDGDGAVARFNYPQGIAVDGSGNIYVADQYNNVIRKITISTSNVNVARKAPITIKHK